MKDKSENPGTGDRGAGAFKRFVEDIYTGRNRRSVLFRYALILFDLATITYFILITPFEKTLTILAVNGVLALLILLDFMARFWIADDRRAHALRVYVIADALVLLSFPLNGIAEMDLTFLRILRGLRLGHSQHLLQDLRRASAFFRRREDAIVAGVNMFVFVFATASAIFNFFGNIDSGPAGYVDALYFTVTTLTTTGYGDLTPTTPMGKIVSMGIMVVGVSLFVHLARTIVMPSKVRHVCGACGLSRHDADAVHCKHCGAIVHIETPGAT